MSVAMKTLSVKPKQDKKNNILPPIFISVTPAGIYLCCPADAMHHKTYATYIHFKNRFLRVVLMYGHTYAKGKRQKK